MMEFFWLFVYAYLAGIVSGVGALVVVVWSLDPEMKNG